VSEFERGKRPHVSLETALRLLHSVGAPVPGSPPLVADEAAARSEHEQQARARGATARRRKTSTG
jgi:hypothetical protein